MVRADDAGGMRPHMWSGTGVELVVRAGTSSGPTKFWATSQALTDEH